MESRHDKRSLVVRELVQTERTYCRDLVVLIDHWMKPLKGLTLLSAEDTSTIFSNVEQLHNLNEQLLASLDGLEELPIEQQDVGARFSSFIDFLKLYIQYCANQAMALNRLSELKKARPDLANALDQMKNQTECNQLDLESFLIKPLQRITKYPLLLKELLRETSETHADYLALERSYNRLAEVVAEINEKKRQSENLVKLIEIQNNFITSTGEEPLKLVSPHRRFVAEGIFKKAKLPKQSIKNCHIFLFNDIILLATEESKLSLNLLDVAKKGTSTLLAKKYVNKSGIIPIGKILLWDGNDPEGVSFSIVRTDESRDKILVFGASREEKEKWMSQINECIVTLPNNILVGSKEMDGIEKFSRSTKAS